MSKSRIVYEQQTASGAWLLMHHEFTSVQEAAEFCDTLNSAARGDRYRVKVITDPTTIAEMDQEKVERFARYDGFMKEFLG